MIQGCLQTRHEGGNIDPAGWEAVAEDHSFWEKYREGMRSEERGAERTAMGREERVQTVEVPQSQAQLSPAAPATEPAYNSRCCISTTN